MLVALMLLRGKMFFAEKQISEENGDGELSQTPNEPIKMSNWRHSVPFFKKEIQE